MSVHRPCANPGPAWTTRYLDYGRPRLNHRRRRHRNPRAASREVVVHRSSGSSSSRGGMGMGTVALIGGAAFLFLTPTGRALASRFTGGYSVPAGYTPIGNGLYRGPDGRIYAMNPSTGQMVASPTGVTPTSAEDLLLKAGITIGSAALPGLISWIGSLFGTSVSGAPAPSGGTFDPGTFNPSQDPGGLGPLPPLPSSGPEWFPSDPGGLDPLPSLPTLPQYPYDPAAWDMPTLAALPDLPTVQYPWWDAMTIDTMPAQTGDVFMTVVGAGTGTVDSFVGP